MRSAFGVVLAGLILFPGPGSGQVPRLSGDASPKGGVMMQTPSGSGATYDGKTLAQWKLDVKDADASKRTAALLAFLHFGDASSSAVSVVLDRLQDRDISPRAKAVVVLRYLAVDPSDVNRVVAALAKRINPEFESQAVIRYEAARTLERFIQQAGPAIPSLIVGTRDRASWEIRQICAALLWRAAMDARSGPDPRAVQGLLDALRADKTYQVRLEILQGLAMMGKPSNPQVLGRMINDLNLCARSQDHKPLAIWAYAGLAALSDPATSNRAMGKITKYLDKNEDLEVRAQAAHALGTLGPLAKDRVPALLVMLKDREAPAVNGACLALIRIGDRSEAVVEGLLEVLNHADPHHAMGAVKAIVDLKLNTPRVTSAMDKMLEKKDLNLNLRAWIEQGLKELKQPKK